MPRHSTKEPRSRVAARPAVTPPTPLPAPGKPRLLLVLAAVLFAVWAGFLILVAISP